MSNRIKFAANIRHKGFFTTIPVKGVEDSEYVYLWRAVLDTSLSDLIRGKENLKNTENVSAEWRDLQEWFDSENHDFQTVCGFSELMPDMTYKIMRYCVSNADDIDRKSEWNDIILSILLAEQKVSVSSQ